MNATTHIGDYFNSVADPAGVVPSWFQGRKARLLCRQRRPQRRRLPHHEQRGFQLPRPWVRDPRKQRGHRGEQLHAQQLRLDTACA